MWSTSTGPPSRLVLAGVAALTRPTSIPNMSPMLAFSGPSIPTLTSTRTRAAVDALATYGFRPATDTSYYASREAAKHGATTLSRSLGRPVVAGWSGLFGRGDLVVFGGEVFAES